jgi:hypothetical protein
LKAELAAAQHPDLPELYDLRLAILAEEAEYETGAS